MRVIWLSPASTLSFGYGNHSRLEPLPLYFVEKEGDNRPNKDLKLSRAHHFVIAYDKKLSSSNRLKIEGYYQYLYDIPIDHSSYSALNFSQQYVFDEILESQGIGRNYGLELSLEHFLNKGFYYLGTASLFSSEYSNDGGISWHNTRFNYGYIFNGLVGKEFTPYKNKNKIVGINFKLTAQGAERISPVDVEASAAAQSVVFDHTRPFEDRMRNTLYVDLSLTQKSNKTTYSTVWGLQVKNMLASEGEFFYKYNYVDQKPELTSARIFFPNLFYKINF